MWFTVESAFADEKPTLMKQGKEAGDGTGTDMSTGLLVLLIITGVLIVGVIVLYFIGRKMQKKQEASEEQMKAGAQPISMLVLEKKRVRLKDAGFPQIVIDQTPKYLRRSKVPVVKAKIGPRTMSMMCDEKAFALIPEKREVKCIINGIYIMEAKWARGGLLPPPAKKTFRQKLKDKYASLKDDKKDSKKNDKKAAKTEEKKSGKKADNR